jgi:hypothetical protein
MPDAHVVIDYQNIHLTGHGRWCPEGDPAHLCLIHPLHFATQLLGQRNLIKRLVAERDDVEHEDAVLKAVYVYRGQPSNQQSPNHYRRSQAQQSEWTRDPRVTVQYRTLKYYRDGTVKEKGIDVLVALRLVVCAAADDGLVILAAHDTDQEPALELARQLAGDRVETAGWRGERVLRVPGQRIWHTALDEEHFIKARDRKQY